MPHIHTEPGQHDLVVNMFIIRLDFDQPRLMLHWHRKFNGWLQFGGHVELNEDPWQAAQHELLEESGYELGQLKVLQPKGYIKNIPRVKIHPAPVNINTHKVSDSHNHIAIDWAFVTDQDPLHQPDEGESEKFLLATREDVVNLPEAELFPGMREIFLYVFDYILPNWEQLDTEAAQS